MKKTIITPRVLAFGLACLSMTLLAQTAFAHGMSEAEKQAIVEGGNLAFLWLGATHMLTGYDHLLLRDSGSGLLARDALVGSGMIVLTAPRPS